VIPADHELKLDQRVTVGDAVYELRFVDVTEGLAEEGKRQGIKNSRVMRYYSVSIILMAVYLKII
jgi:hypothetical protein